MYYILFIYISKLKYIYILCIQDNYDHLHIVCEGFITTQITIKLYGRY